MPPLGLKASLHSPRAAPPAFRQTQASIPPDAARHKPAPAATEIYACVDFHPLWRLSHGQAREKAPLPLPAPLPASPGAAANLPMRRNGRAGSKAKDFRGLAPPGEEAPLLQAGEDAMLFDISVENPRLPAGPARQGRSGRRPDSSGKALNMQGFVPQTRNASSCLARFSLCRGHPSSHPAQGTGPLGLQPACRQPPQSNQHPQGG